MARTVHRFDIGPAGKDITLPHDATVIAVDHGPIPGLIDVWVLLDTNAPTQARRFTYTGTGHPVPEDAHHIASTPRHGDTGLVWHLFEIRQG